MKSLLIKDESVQTRIKQNGSIYGNKAANLMELDAVSKIISSDIIKIEIPPIFPIADDVIKAHLDQKTSKKWRELWDAFVQEQGKSKALTEPAKIKLKELHDLITTTFK